MWSLFCDQKGSKMPTFIQTILTAIKGASLTAKIIGVATAVVVVGGTTAVIIVQSNSSNQELQNVETNNDLDENTEQEKAVDNEETETQDESSDNQENGTSEQPKTDNVQTSNSGTSKPDNSNQSGSSSQPTTAQPVAQPQPTTPKAEFNLNDSIAINVMGITCYNSSTGETFPTTGYLDIVATGQHFSYGPGYCPEEYFQSGNGWQDTLSEQWCESFGLSCDRW